MEISLQNLHADLEALRVKRCKCTGFPDTYLPHNDFTNGKGSSNFEQAGPGRPQVDF